MKFIPDLPTIRWIAGELVIGYFICLLPVLLTSAFDEQTLMVGLILASMFLIPAEFARLNKAKSKYREIEIPVGAVTASQDSQITKEDVIASQDIQITEEIVNPENLSYSQDASSPWVVIPRQEERLTSETLSVFIDAAPEDMALVPPIEEFLKANKIEYKPPLDFSKASSTIRKELEGNLSSCNIGILLYDKASPQWLQQQLIYCRRSRAWRKQPLEPIVYTPTDKPDLRKRFPDTRILNKLEVNLLFNFG
jgi:hypothetical protein